MSGERPPSVQSQVVLAGHSARDVRRMLAGLAAAGRSARAEGLLDSLTVRLGDVGPAPCLEPADVAALGADAAAGGIDALDHVRLADLAPGPAVHDRLAATGRGDL